MISDQPQKMSERVFEKLKLLPEPPPCPPILGGSEVQSPSELGDLGGECRVGAKHSGNNLLLFRWFINRMLCPYRFVVLFTFLVLPIHWIIAPMSSSLAAVPPESSRVENVVSPSMTQDLDRQGQALYSAGKFDQAAQLFRQAATVHQSQGNSLRQAVSLSNLSLSCQQLGRWAEATQAISDSLTLLQSLSTASEGKMAALAQAYSIQGNLYFSQGQAQQALSVWEAVAKIYDQLGDLASADPSVRARSHENRINQAQALQALGLHRRAIATLSATLKLEPQTVTNLDSLQNHLKTLPVTPTTITALQSLGEALRITGNLAQARVVLDQSLLFAERLNLPEAKASAKFRLGNVSRAQAFATLSSNNMTLSRAMELIKSESRYDETEIAQKFLGQVTNILDLYQQATALTTSPMLQTQIQLNQLSLLVDTQQTEKVQTLLPKLQQQIDRSPPSRINLDNRINFAQSLMQLRLQKIENKAFPTYWEIGQLLSVTAQQAKNLNYQRAESYAVGMLGRLYEQTEQREEAKGLTQRALSLAQLLQAWDIAYLWQWQLGRLHRAQGNSQAAIAAYQDAVDMLKSVRKELAAAALEEQYSFRDTVEPIHRELVELLLNSGGSAQDQQKLEAARKVIESLQLTELINFFREDCLITKSVQIDQIDTASAVFYPIILPKQLAVIVSISGQERQELTYFATPVKDEVTRERIERAVSNLHSFLRQSNTPEAEFLPEAEHLYDWLIRPAKEKLRKNGIKNLVFVLNGVLQNIPIAVLRDSTEKQYLIQQYSIALTPGLQLLESQSLKRENIKVLAGGLSAGQPPLPYVESELKQIEMRVPGSKILLNDQFTNQRLQVNVQEIPFPIVHLATHGKFSSQLENTYIDTWDGRLNINQLRDVLQTRSLNNKKILELLVLSACETATGDSRAALGLAGVAVRAGARSTLGTLWQVNDESSAALMGQFYAELTKPEVTKAEALRQAQLSLLKDYPHPYHWAPYVLLGNWR